MRESWTVNAEEHNAGRGPTGLSRTTGRPARRPPRQKRQALEVVKRYTPEELVGQLGLTEEQVNMLDQIAAGHPPRNANAIMRAIEAKLTYTQPKPKQELVVTTSFAELVLQAEKHRHEDNDE